MVIIAVILAGILVVLIGLMFAIDGLGKNDRDEFAKAALTSIVANYQCARIAGIEDAATIARDCYRIADAMLERRREWRKTGKNK
jgi:hypothetical protein